MLVFEIGSPYLPLGKPEIHLPATLGNESLILLQAAADGTGRDGQVAVVAVCDASVSTLLHPGYRQVRGGFRGVEVDRAWAILRLNVRETSGFPSGSHFGGISW